MHIDMPHETIHYVTSKFAFVPKKLHNSHMPSTQPKSICHGCGKARVIVLCSLCDDCYAVVVPPAPPTPTTALPGTEAKIAVMESRVASGFQPHQTLDARRAVT